jgi:hypothetical protein
MAEFYLSDPTGRAFTGNASDIMGDFCCISHDCPKCGELASKGRTLAWLSGECGKKGAAKFPCPKCGTFLEFPKEAFRPAAMEELQRHFQPNALLRAMTAEEVLDPHWPALVVRANGIGVADDAVEGTVVRATINLQDGAAAEAVPATSEGALSPLDEILALAERMEVDTPGEMPPQPVTEEPFDPETSLDDIPPPPEEPAALLDDAGPTEALDFTSELEAPLYTGTRVSDLDDTESAGAMLDEPDASEANEADSMPDEANLDMGGGLDFGTFDVPAPEPAPTEAAEVADALDLDFESSLDLDGESPMEEPAEAAEVADALDLDFETSLEVEDEPPREEPGLAVEPLVLDDSPASFTLADELDDAFVEPKGLDEAVAGTAATVAPLDRAFEEETLPEESADLVELDYEVATAETDVLDLNEGGVIDLDFEEPRPTPEPPPMPGVAATAAPAPAWSGSGPCPRCGQRDPKQGALRLRCPHCESLFFVKGGQLSQEANTPAACPACRAEFMVPVSIWCDTCHRTAKPFRLIEEELKAANAGVVPRRPGEAAAMGGGKRGLFGRKK